MQVLYAFMHNPFDIFLLAIVICELCQGFPWKCTKVHLDSARLHSAPILKLNLVHLLLSSKFYFSLLSRKFVFSQTIDHQTGII